MNSLTERLGQCRDAVNSVVAEIPLLGPLLRHRFTKFGTVGLAGTGVNLSILYVGQEWVFSWIAVPSTRLRLSLAAAIFLATLHNFLWNRIWTWRKRRRTSLNGFFVQMGQYYLACSLAIGVQYSMTLVFAKLTHYILANITACTLAAIINFLANDLWTFAKRKLENIP